MPNLPISSLPELTAVTANSEFAVEYSGTTYKIKQKTLSPLPTVYGIFSQTGNSTPVSATTVESSIVGPGDGTLIFPPLSLRGGDCFRADFGGYLSAKNNDTVRIRVKVGSIILADSGTQTLNATTNDVFQVSINLTVRALGGPGVASVVSL